MRSPALLACAAYLALGCSFSAFCQSDCAEITACSGIVEVLLEGTEEYVPAEDGMQLEAGDTLRTSYSGSCELSFNQANTNIVRLEETTSLKLLFTGDEKLEMTQGEVFASISELPSGSAFEIRTPTAVSGARGTDWVTTVSGEDTEIEAIDSTPYVRHYESAGVISRQEMPVPAGKKTSVRQFQPPEPPRQMAAHRMQKWQGARNVMRQNGQQALMRKPGRPPFRREEFKEKIQQERPHYLKPRPAAGATTQGNAGTQGAPGAAAQQDKKMPQPQDKKPPQPPPKNPPPARAGEGKK